MKKKKTKLVASLFCTMFFCILFTACWLWPVVIPWVLSPFALAGALKFCRTTYLWMLTNPEEEEEFW